MVFSRWKTYQENRFVCHRLLRIVLASSFFIHSNKLYRSLLVRARNSQHGYFVAKRHGYMYKLILTGLFQLQTCFNYTVQDKSGILETDKSIEWNKNAIMCKSQPWYRVTRRGLYNVPKIPESDICIVIMS